MLVENRNTSGFCVLGLHAATLLNPVISSSSCFIDSLESSTHVIILVYAQRQFHFSLSNFDVFNFFCLPHCTDSTMLNGNTGRGHICFFCGLRRKPSVFHHYDVSDRVFARGRFSGLRKLSSIPHLQRSVFLFCFILKRICIKSQLQ